MAVERKRVICYAVHTYAVFPRNLSAFICESFDVKSDTKMKKYVTITSANSPASAEILLTELVEEADQNSLSNTG